VAHYSDRHARDEKLRRSRARVRPVPAESTISGVVSGEFDRIPEANDIFLELAGYSREDLLAGRLVPAPKFWRIDFRSRRCTTLKNI
jgi:hypothetical protein